jgi:hypothetical protein
MGNKIRKAARATVTAEYARKILNYDPETGIFTWRERPGRTCVIGAVASAVQKGRNTVTLGGTRFQASNVAWLYVYGEWPDFEVDHRDRDKFNDAIGNLRSSTTMKNMMNMGKTARNTSGFKGVSPHGDRFVVWIRADGYKYYLGRFRQADHGAAVYRIAAAGMHAEFSGV